MFEVRSTEIPGCVVLIPTVKQDARGRFVKVFHQQWFEDHGFDTDLREEYFSDSHTGVLRGMHFQRPPFDHVKLVYVVRGAVMDVVVDLRIGSPAYGRAEVIELDSDRAAMVYVPKGLAHGFFAREASTMVYRVSTVYAPAFDSGVLWSSIDVPWPDPSPIVSERDCSFPVLGAIASPFIYA